mmetsp:Transcript_44856/g.118541  ORF Transcript_44856/g.118541 Transcript_44856/m.118541 type:complete len:312 (-) Transcript_44856:318-1253(-)
MSLPVRTSAHMTSRLCSSIWSASSSTTLWMKESEILPESMRSRRRPGVAQTMSIWLFSILCCWNFRLSPPYSTCCTSGVPFVRTSISLAVCAASSRVGARTSMRGQPGDLPGKKGRGVAPLITMRATVGMTNAKVFPEPVWASAIMSYLPSSCPMMGTACRWMGVGRLSPAPWILSSRNLFSRPLSHASCQESIGAGRSAGSRLMGMSSSVPMWPSCSRRWSARMSRMSISLSESSSPPVASAGAATAFFFFAARGFSKATLTGRSHFFSKFWMASQSCALHCVSPTLTTRHPTPTPAFAEHLSSAIFSTT